jgi:hypothetical protein
MAGYKALMSMALNGRHELLSLLLQTGITTAQHALLLLESVIQKKGRLASIERVVAEMLRYIGPCNEEPGSVLKVAAGHSSSNVVAMLVDWCHRDKVALDLQLLGLALAEACDCKNDEVMQLILKCWKGKCTAMQAQPLLRAFAARGDASTVERLLSHGSTAMVQMDTQQRAKLAGSGLSHVAGEGKARKQVFSMLLQAGADPRGHDGELALRNAARDGQADSMQLLLGNGTNVNAVDEDGRTVLCVAACSGCTATVRCLLEHGAQVRMRCHDGREPLDFAVDESVRQLLLAEVEKLRMGLLDELLADEDDDKNKKGKKGKKAAKADAKKAASEGAKTGADAALTKAAPEKTKAAAAAPVPTARAEAASNNADADPDGAPTSSKNAKKKQQKKAKAAAAAAESGATATAVGDGAGAMETSADRDGHEAAGPDTEGVAEAAAALGDTRHSSSCTATLTGPGSGMNGVLSNGRSGSGSVGSGSAGSTGGGSGGDSCGNTSGGTGNSARGAAPASGAGTVALPKSPGKKAKGSSKVASPQADQHASPKSLLEAAGYVLRTQTNGPSMRLSLLVSALYELSASFREEIKKAGGPKTWLSEHADEFFLDTNCAPGHESVTLCAPLPPPPAAAARRAAATLNAHGDADTDDASLDEVSQHREHDAYHLNGNGSAQGFEEHEATARAHENEHMHAMRGPIRVPPRVPNALHPANTRLYHHAMEGSEDEPLSPPRPLLRDDELPEAQSCSLSWSGPNGRAAADAADEAAAAALLGSASEEATKDPLLIEKKIRAVQKKLRRVQTIEQQQLQVGSEGSALDDGQQVLLASKPRLQAQLTTLLQQWAVLEPALLERQEQQLLAIRDSECAICLEEYSLEHQGIRTSCCGYHFHNKCLQQCIEKNGHCPICSAPRGMCKVVQQRARQAQVQGGS